MFKKNTFRTYTGSQNIKKVVYGVCVCAGFASEAFGISGQNI